MCKIGEQSCCGMYLAHFIDHTFFHVHQHCSGLQPANFNWPVDAARCVFVDVAAPGTLRLLIGAVPSPTGMSLLCRKVCQSPQADRHGTTCRMTIPPGRVASVVYVSEEAAAGKSALSLVYMLQMSVQATGAALQMGTCSLLHQTVLSGYT